MKRKKLSTILAVTFVWVAVLSISISLAITLGVMTQQKYLESTEILKKSVEDVTDSLSDIIQEDIGKKIVYIEENIWYRLSSIKRSSEEDVTEFLSFIKDREGYEELCIADVDGVVVSSADPGDIGFDFYGNERLSAFTGLLEDENICIKEAKSEKTGKMIQYAGAPFPDRSGFVFMGVDHDALMDSCLPQLKISMRNRRIGNEGFLLLCDMDYNILFNSYSDENVLNSDEFVNELEDSLGKDAPVLAIVDGRWQLVCASEEHGFYIVGFYPFYEAIEDLINTVYVIILIEILIFALVFLIVYLILRGKIVKEIEGINRSLFKISEGDTEERIDVQGSQELNLLSEHINGTLEKLREMADREAAARKRELKLSYDLRQASVPTSYPAFPQQEKFGIYALIRPSGELARDFYDYFYTDEGKLAFVLTDIRGEGINVIIFMMVLKYVLKSFLASNLHVDEALNKTNRLLFENPNYTELFMSACVWAGLLDIDTGKLEYCSAGGLRPVLVHKGEVCLVKQKEGAVLFMKEDFDYARQELELKDSDMLVLYSDGVTEAVNNKKEYYGDDRLMTVIAGMKGSRYDSGDLNRDCKNVCESISADIASFAGKQKLPDDMALIALKKQ